MLDWLAFLSYLLSDEHWVIVEQVPAYAIPFTLVGLAGYLNNGGCACGCGYGEGGCIYAQLNGTWQPALPHSAGAVAGDATAVPCGGLDVRTPDSIPSPDLNNRRGFRHTHE
jgi:hypothetical protein